MSKELKPEQQEAPNQAIKVFILNSGHVENDANLVVVGTVVGTKQCKNPTVQWIKVPIYAVLVDHPQRKILFDLGMRPGYLYPKERSDITPTYQRKEQLLERQLALAGCEPKDVSAVVLSHFHWDHCGNLHLFDHAEIYLNPSELKSNPAVRVLPGISIKKPHYIYKDSDIVPGVRVITLPGHTVGTLGMVVRLKEEGTLIFTSDAVPSKGNYGPPARLQDTVYDNLRYFKSIEKVRRLEAKYKARVMFSHDMELFQTMKKAPAFYK
jgi:glyoxylase-like metal-dependent hydrolase (beta-lactamase superfamily II)